MDSSEEGEEEEEEEEREGEGIEEYKIQNTRREKERREKPI